MSKFIVRYGKIILAVFVLLAIFCGWLMTRVEINSDMSKYLPEDSPVRRGAEIMSGEFSPASTFNLLFEDFDGAGVYEKLSGIPLISDIARYAEGGRVLFVITLDAAAYTREADGVIAEVKDMFSSYDIEISGGAAGNTAMDILPTLMIIAFVILFIILTLMCKSWIEPLLLLFAIGVAVVINLGTNIIFKSVSDITSAIAAILQLVLSMDYSIMMLNRYRQERERCETKEEAMAKAVRGAFVTISSSSVTTIVGMLALVFMSFTIGRDMGFVLAKGVFFSLLCIFTVLPALVLMFDKVIEKTAKKALRIRMDKIGAASCRVRYAVPVVFLALFVTAFFLRGNLKIAYTMTDYYKAYQFFETDNPIVVLYSNEDEEKVAALAEKWEGTDAVTGVNAYATTLGKALSQQELAYVTGIDEAMIRQLFFYRAMSTGTEPEETMPLYDFMTFLINAAASDPALAAAIPGEMRAELARGIAEMENGRGQLVGAAFSRAIINTNLPEESEETFALIESIERDLSGLSGERYIVGNSAAAHEMSKDFPSEMNRITILTVVAIFLVVALAFRSLSVPLILVCVIQCAVFFTMGIAYLQGNSMHYLPLLIVQCLLLGATVDYGILLSSYYREARKTFELKDAIISALNNSIHTIFTSGLILVTVTSALGIFLQASDPAIAEILVTIATGGICALLLIIFILPGLLVAFDRFVVRRKS